MKKFWRRALRLATLATVIPVSITHDDITGETTYQSLLASLRVGPGKDGVTTDVGVNLGDGVLSGAIRQIIAVQKESAMYADSELTSPGVKTDGPVIVRPAQESAPAEESAVPEAPLDEAEKTDPLF